MIQLYENIWRGSLFYFLALALRILRNVCSACVDKIFWFSFKYSTEKVNANVDENLLFELP
jgi:hypothetical protein